MSTNTNTHTRIVADQKLKAGYDKHLAADGNVVSGAHTWTPTDVDALLQASLDAENAVEAARGAFHDAVAAARKAREDFAVLRAVLKQLALLRFADQAGILADFGLKPKTSRARKVEDKAKAVALGKSTRQARHTLGARQRERIKGEALPAAPPATPTTPAATSGATPTK